MTGAGELLPPRQGPARQRQREKQIPGIAPVPVVENHALRPLQPGGGVHILKEAVLSPPWPAEKVLRRPEIFRRVRKLPERIGAEPDRTSSGLRQKVLAQQAVLALPAAAVQHAAPVVHTGNEYHGCPSRYAHRRWNITATWARLALPPGSRRPSTPLISPVPTAHRIAPAA